MKKIIAFTGKMFSGKSTALAAVEGAENIKFAQPLYDIQSYIYQRIGRDIPQPKDRKLLQWVGTDWGRSVDEALWVNVWKEEVAACVSEIITCDDCRFDNEAEAVRAMGGVVIRIVAPEETRASRGEALGLKIVDHASEAGISDELVDYEIHNIGDAETLQAMVRSVLEAL